MSFKEKLAANLKLWLIIIVIFLLLITVVQNSGVVTLKFLFFEFPAVPLVVVIAASVLIGMILGALVLLRIRKAENGD